MEHPIWPEESEQPVYPPSLRTLELQLLGAFDAVTGQSAAE